MISDTVPKLIMRVCVCVCVCVHFCRFLNGGDEAFSTEPLKNENQDLALGFYHMQNVRRWYSHSDFEKLLRILFVCFHCCTGVCASECFVH